MTGTTRLVVNTLAQDVRTVINIVLSLFSTRIVMDTLGVSDYGIYMLVAGVVSLLSYLVNALVTTTQRHLSYNYGEGNMEKVRSFFANSYLLHWIVGLTLAAIALSFTSAIFERGWLSVPADRVTESQWVYLLVVCSVFVTFITAPFRALLIAHENIVYISIVDVLDGILKLGLVFTLYLFDDHRLSLYALIMVIVMLFNLLMLAGYSRLHYDECMVIPRPSRWNSNIQRQLVGFTTWTLYGTACVFLRTQGIAVILNRTFGTVMNAAYGIATQVFGSVQFLSEAIANAIRPRVAKLEGGGDRVSMIKLSLLACKYCFLLIGIVVIPIIFELPELLHIWLGTVPEHTATFCRFMLLATLFDQLTIGLNIANTAIGRIKVFTLLVFSVKALTLPAVLIVIILGGNVLQIMMVYLLMELLSGVVRIVYFKYFVGLRLLQFSDEVISRIIGPLLSMCLVCWFVTAQFDFAWRFILTGILSTTSACLAYWVLSATADEKKYINSNILKHIKLSL